jgi:putative transposase
MLTGKPNHLRTSSYVGLQRYFLTFCTDRRRQSLTTAPVVELVLAQFQRAAADDQFAILAYCFMPDHVHLLIEGESDSSDCLRFIARAKQFAGAHYAKSFGGRLWQRYGYEHVLRDDEQTLAVARYILENPVRAKLVARPQDHPFLGSARYSVSEILDAAGSG